MIKNSKKLLAISAVALLLLSGCGNNPKKGDSFVVENPTYKVEYIIDDGAVIKTIENGYEYNEEELAGVQSKIDQLGIDGFYNEIVENNKNDKETKITLNNKNYSEIIEDSQKNVESETITYFIDTNEETVTVSYPNSDDLIDSVKVIVTLKGNYSEALKDDNKFNEVKREIIERIRVYCDYEGHGSEFNVNENSATLIAEIFKEQNPNIISNMLKEQGYELKKAESNSESSSNKK